MGRSGTTLLTNMLNSHPNIVACPENEFIIFLQHNFKSKDFSKSEVVESFLEIFNLEYNRVLSFWKPDLNALKKDIENLENKSFANVCKLVYLNYPFAEKTKIEVSCIVDKNPIHSVYLDEISSLFPNAKYIIISRDYKDNIVSRRTYSDKKSSIVKLAVSWNYFYQKIEKAIKLKKLTTVNLKYENLVSDTENELKKICDFINVEYNNKMLDFQILSKKIKAHIQETASKEKFDKISSMHQNLEKKVSAERVGSYHSKLTKDEIDILDYVCGNEASKLGYNFNSNEQSIHFKNKVKFQFYHFYIPFYYSIERIVHKLPISLKKIMLKKKDK